MIEVNRERTRFVLYFTVACVGSIALGLALTDTPLSEDPKLYFDRVQDVVSGGVPYVHTELEHLPVSFVPMIMAWYLGGSSGIPAFTLVFAILMSIALYVSASAVRKVGIELGVDGADWSFLLIASPLFPLVVFRNDAVSVALTGLGLLALVRGGVSKGTLLTGIAIAAKGWPLVLSVGAWWRGHRLAAASLAVWTGSLILTLLAMPGFRAGRSFGGIHFETVLGSLVGFVRSARGDSLGLFEAAGAVYIDVPTMTVFFQAGLGLAVLAFFSWRLMRRTPTWERIIRLSAGITLCLLLGSPLFSAQFVLWPLLFVALVPSKTVRWGAATVSLLTVVYVALWPGLFSWTSVWMALIVIRNILVVFLVLALGLERLHLDSEYAAE
jgi:hypothetical protein